MSSKLKMPITHIISICSVLFLITLIAEDQLNGTAYVFWFWGGAIIVWDFIYSRRTNLPVFNIIGIVGGTAVWHYVLAAIYDTPLTIATWLLHMIILISVGIFQLHAKFNKHAALEKNAFRLFKLASQNVWATTDGFTSRPYPGGSLSAVKEDIHKFAGFMYDKNIAKSVIKDDLTYLMFSMNTSPLSNPPDGPPTDKVSYALFDGEGNLSVSISQDDYKQYREEYNFEQLCSSLSEIFKNFFELHKEGKEYNIIEKMSSVKLNPFN